MLNGVYRQHQAAQNFLSNYDNQAVAMILFNVHSGSLWTITPPDLLELRDEVASGNSCFYLYTKPICAFSP